MLGLPAGLNIAQAFQQSRDHGLEHIGEIASAWAPRLNLSTSLIAEYLTDNVDYSLDLENLEGLNLFYRYGAEAGVFERTPELDFLDLPSAIQPYIAK